MKHSLLKAFLALMLAVLSVCSLAACGTGESGNTPCTTCEDKDKNHLCDTCKKELSACGDADKNHKCDLCEKVLSTCKDEDKNHKCDLCGVSLGTCEDKNKDHSCDLCAAPIGNHAADAGSHLCTYCGKAASTCADENNDHACDTCKKALSECKDLTKDHKCDVCQKPLTQCTDESKDHLCDICQTPLSKCDDADLDGNCDLCGAPVDPAAPSVPSVLGLYDLNAEADLPAGPILVSPDGTLRLRVRFDMSAKDAYFDVNGKIFYTQAIVDNDCEYEITFPISKDMQIYTLTLHYEDNVIATYECEVAPFHFFGIYTDISDLNLLYPPTYVDGLVSGESITLYLAMSAPVLPTKLYTAEMGTLPMVESPWIIPPDSDVCFYTVCIPGDMLYPFGSESGGSRKLAFEIEQENLPPVFVTYTVNFANETQPGDGETPEQGGQTPENPEGGQTGGMIAILDVYNEVTQSSVPTNENLFFGYGDGKICITVRLNRNVESIYFVNDEMMCTGEASGTEGEYYFTIGFPPAEYERMGELKLCVWENETQTTIGHYSYLVAAAEFYGIYTDPSQLNTQTKPRGVTVPCGETAVIYIATTAISVDPTELYISRGGSDDIHLEFYYNPWDNELAYIDHDAGFSLPIGFYRVEIPADLMELGEGETFGTHEIAFISERDGEKIWATYTVNFSR